MKLQATKVASRGHVDEYTVIQDETLRDKFAMAALTGLIGTKGMFNWEEVFIKTAAEKSYLIADAMMKAKAK